MMQRPHQQADEGSLFRSEDMSLVQLYIPSELAHSSVSELGELGLLQFKDLNPDVNAFQRSFVQEIRRLDEMERKARFLSLQCEKAHIHVKPSSSTALSLASARPRTVQEMDDLESKLVELELKVKEMNSSREKLRRKFLELTELKHVLQESAHFFFAAETRPEINMLPTEDEYLSTGTGPASDPETGSRYSASIHLSFVSGTIPQGKMAVFEKVLWRALRGNMYLDFSPVREEILDPETEEPSSKNVFIVFAHGDILIKKITKISEALGATVYPIGSSGAQRSEELTEITGRLDDIESVLSKTENTRKLELIRVAEMIDQWTVFIKKEKAVYHHMNMFNFDNTRKSLIAEAWCPTSAINAVQYALHAVSERSGSMVPPIVNELRSTETPPTYHKTNKFTHGFQKIVDAYGIATYKEVNPGLFTCITFPFLFAVMFGDIGHGAFVALIGLYLVWYEKRLEKQMSSNEIGSTVFGGRYIILLMGLFAVFVGFMYNDIFSLPVYLGESGWDIEINHGKNKTDDSFVSNFKFAYAFGIDPAWRLAENSLLFLNSYKMKMSIVLGVIHMSFGIFLTVYNSKYFKKTLNIYCEFIPQILFMWSIFGYLVFMIIFKWCYPWNVPNGNPPGLLNTLIFMFLSPGDLKAGQLYSGQAVVQTILLILAGISVPWMLCVKPYILWKMHQRNIAAGYRTVDGDSPSTRSHASDPGGTSLVESRNNVNDVSEVINGANLVAHAEQNSGNHSAAHGKEKFEMGEIIVHQVIHTIEFCLGAISNTASYLRLWALSLAHSQLSEVLWEMTLRATLLNPILLLVGYFMWFSLTLGILIVMEGLSAFLHALRLHWVEFNNKFYEGSGVEFQPFSFKKVLEDSQAQDAANTS